MGKERVGKELLGVVVEKGKKGVEVGVVYDAMGWRRVGRKFLGGLMGGGGRVSGLFGGITGDLKLEVK